MPLASERSSLSRLGSRSRQYCVLFWETGASPEGRKVVAIACVLCEPLGKRTGLSVRGGRVPVFCQHHDWTGGSGRNESAAKQL